VTPDAKSRGAFVTAQTRTSDELQDMARQLPNENVSWDEWNKVGMAFYFLHFALFRGMDTGQIERCFAMNASFISRTWK
jgi:hypothetical protein